MLFIRKNPLIRWTLGNVSEDGFDVFLESIKSWKRFYGDLSFIVCYNEAISKHVNKIIEMKIPALNQMQEYNDNVQKYLWKPSLCGWKLYPPRLNLNSYEIFCDNDIILTKKINIIDEFLHSNMVFSCSAISRCFGCFDKFIPEGLKFNNGLFGIPPFFDLELKIKEMQIMSGNENWLDFFDEQGIVSSIFLKHHNFQTISMNEIYNCSIEFKYCNGIHFCGINRGENDSWKLYKKITILYD